METDDQDVYDSQATLQEQLTIVGIHTVQSDNGGTTSWNQDCVNETCDDAPSAWTYTNSNGDYDGSKQNNGYNTRCKIIIT